MDSGSDDDALRENQVAARAHLHNVDVAVAAFDDLCTGIAVVSGNAAEAASVALRAVEMAQTTVQVVGKRDSPDELGRLVAAVAQMTDHMNLVALNTHATVEALTEVSDLMKLIVDDLGDTPTS